MFGQVVACAVGRQRLTLKADSSRLRSSKHLSQRTRLARSPSFCASFGVSRASHWSVLHLHPFTWLPLLSPLEDL